MQDINCIVGIVLIPHCRDIKIDIVLEYNI